MGTKWLRSSCAPSNLVPVRQQIWPPSAILDFPAIASPSNQWRNFVETLHTRDYSQIFPLLLLAAKIMWFSSITQVTGVIEQFGLRRYASFSDALTMRWRNKKLVTNIFSTFTAGSKISSITRVIGVIEQFGLRRYASFIDALTTRWRNKKLVTKFFPLLLLAANFRP